MKLYQAGGSCSKLLTLRVISRQKAQMLKELSNLRLHWRTTARPVDTPGAKPLSVQRNRRSESTVFASATTTYITGSLSIGKNKRGCGF